MPVFNIFPAGGFDTSILTVVFLGLVIRWMFTESFGFTFVGLVVPGYLASVFVISPVNGAVIVFESIVTYGLVRLLADGFAKTDAWSNLFGRDRFFAFLFVSIWVRMLSELWLLPAGWSLLGSTLGTTPTLSTGFNSVGLVLVPLTANMFWKVGLRRGVWQIGLPTVLVYLITVQILDPLTNLRFSEFQVHYEDAAIDLLSSPRPYIVMLVTAAIAGRANLSFGWDFGGILIPALIAVTWTSPEKAVVTVAEALILTAVGTWVLQSRFAKSTNLEGPRKIVVLFSIGFLLKFIFAWILITTYPHVRVIDFFGFGYLLSTLLALKMVQKKNVPVVLVPTILVSVAGILCASLIIALIPNTDFRPVVSASLRKPETVESLDRYVVDAAPLAASQPQYGPAIRPDEIGKWRGFAKSFLDPELVASTCDTASLNVLGLSCTSLELDGQATFFVSEPAESFPDGRGWGVYWFSPGRTGPAVVARTVDGNPLRALALADIADALDARVVVMSAATKTPTISKIAAEDRFASPHVAVVESLNIPIVEIDFGTKGKTTLVDVDASIDLSGLDQLMTRRRKVVWDPTVRNFDVRLELTRSEVYEVVSRRQNEEPVRIKETQLSKVLFPRLEGPDRRVAGEAAELGNPFSNSDLNGIESAIYRPLISSMVSPDSDATTSNMMRAISRVSAAYNLSVDTIITPQSCWRIVSEVETPLRGAGVFVSRCEARAPVTVAIPRPYDERNMLSMASLLVPSFDASTIVFGSKVLTEQHGPQHGYRVASTMSAALRAINAPENPENWTIQVRGVGRGRLKTELLVTSTGPISVHDDSKPNPLAEMILREFDATFDRGEDDHVGYRTTVDESAKLFRSAAFPRLIRLWVSARFRDRFDPSISEERLEDLRTRFALERGAFFEGCIESGVDTDRVPVIAEQIRLFTERRNPTFFEHAVSLAESENDGATIVVDDVFGMPWFSFCGGGKRYAVKIGPGEGNAQVNSEMTVSAALSSVVEVNR